MEQQPYNPNDPDGDGLDTYIELYVFGTDPYSKDTDNDLLSDIFEIEFPDRDLNPLESGFPSWININFPHSEEILRNANLTESVELLTDSEPISPYQALSLHFYSTLLDTKLKEKYPELYESLISEPIDTYFFTAVDSFDADLAPSTGERMIFLAPDFTLSKTTLELIANMEPSTEPTQEQRAFATLINSH